MKNIMPTIMKKKKAMSPEAYLKLRARALLRPGSTKIIPPEIGKGGFGKILITGTPVPRRKKRTIA